MIRWGLIFSYFSLGVVLGSIWGAWLIYSAVVSYIALHGGAALERKLGEFVDWNRLRRENIEE